MIELIGWSSSIVLLLTILSQIGKQWRMQSSQGVSKWLFIGQMTASSGFLAYSWLIDNWVFVVTNFLMLLSALTGLVVLMYHRRVERNTDSHHMSTHLEE